MILADIKETVNAEDVKSGLVYENNILKIYSDYVKHGHGLGISQESWKCLGYRIEAEGKTATISGDTVDCQGLTALAKDTDALVLCCYLSTKEVEDMEGRLIAKHILACSPQVGEIAKKANAKKLILTHIREKSDALLEEAVREIRNCYNGELIVGHDLLVVDV